MLEHDDFNGSLVYLLDSSSSEQTQVESRRLESTIACVLRIPAFLIPNDIIGFFKSYSSNILSFNILRHSYPKDLYVALLHFTSSIQADLAIHDFNGQNYSSLDSTICHMYKVAAISYNNYTLEFDSKLLGASGSFKDLDNCVIETFQYRKLVDSAVESPDHRCREEDEVSCAVCLESVSRSTPSSFSMYCGHAFHTSCVERLESPLCPVCRFSHESSASSLTSCAVCGWGDNSLSLSTIATYDALATTTPIVAAGSVDRDVWVCLVCGFTGCGRSRQGHIDEHFQTQQHAYAMNTDTRHVWDFAGHGFVHRLAIQDAEDAHDQQERLAGEQKMYNSEIDERSTSDSNTSQGVPSIPPVFGRKLFEVTDPRHLSDQRTVRAPLTSEQEEYTVVAKLESVAAQHSQLLARELEHQRAQHDESLRKLRAFMQSEAAALQLPTQPSSSSYQSHQSNHSKVQSQDTNTPNSQATNELAKAWVAKVKQQLNSERQRAIRMLEQSKNRLAKVEQDLAEAVELRRGLRENEEALQKQVHRAEANLNEMNTVNMNWKANLERKVETLMSQLEG